MKASDSNHHRFPSRPAAPAPPNDSDASLEDSAESRHERILDDEQLRAIHAHALREALRRATGRQ